MNNTELTTLLLAEGATWEYDGKYHVLGSAKSGFHGHKGRPGKRGGSAPRGTVLYREFGLEMEAVEYALKHLSGTVEALQQEFIDADAAGEQLPLLAIYEDRALWAYSAEDAEAINRSLRNLGDRPFKPYFQGSIESLDRAMARPESVVPENIIVRRGFGPKFFDDKPEGTIFKNYGYTSTTIKPEPGNRFGAQAVVRVPQGTRAFYYAQTTVKPAERELLLDRGQRFKVVQNDNDGVIVEVLRGK